MLEEPVGKPGPGDEGGTIDSEFGFDFPSLLDAPLIGEDELINEPVTSGGDSAVRALVAANAESSAEDDQ